jgi:mycothiol synthase
MDNTIFPRSENQMSDIPGFTFRHFQGEADYSLILSILVQSDRADQVSGTPSLDDIRHWCAPSNRFDPTRDILFVLRKDAGGEPTELGFSRVSWYTGSENTRLYTQSSFLLPDWRDHGLWSAMVRQNEHRLQEIAIRHPDTPRRFYQGWATSSQVVWIAVLKCEGYQAVRHFNNMLYRLNDIPERALPTGLVIRPVQPEHFRSIWEAQREVVLNLFETVVENWTDEKYESWLKNPSHTPQLWQVAWDGDQVAGMVLNRIDAVENKELGRKCGYTEHIFVCQPWRKRGLASALLAKSLQVLKAQGMEEAELGVDTENESGAFEFYQKMGYRTFSTDIWFRKPMD